MMRNRILAALAVVCSFGVDVAVAVPVTVLPESKPADSSPSRAATLYRQGLEELVKDNLDAADRAFASASQADSSFAHAALGRAEIASRRNQPDLVARYLAEAQRLAPRDAYVQASMGRYYAIQRDYKKAEAALTAALAADPKFTTARLDLADIYATALNQPDKAIALYRETIAQSPDHSGAHYALGIVLADRNAEESTRALTKAAQLDPKNPLPAIALARLGLRQNQPNRAIEWADKALRIDPQALGAALLRADALFALRKPEEAIRELNTLAKAHPKNAEVQFQNANGLHRAGKLEEAFAAYRVVTELTPNNAIAWNNRAALAIDLKKSPGDAVKWALQATTLAPNDVQFRDTLGWAHRYAGDLQNSVKELTTASQGAKNDPGIWYHLGVVYSDMNRKSDAVNALNRALQIDPSFFAADDARARLRTLK